MDRSFTVGPCLINELITELRKTGLVHNGRLAEDAMSIILTAFRTEGKAKYTHEIEKAGFFLSKDDKIICSKRNFAKPMIQQAKDCCSFLN